MKALHASKGRKSAHQFIAEGPAAVNAALAVKRFPVEALYLTEDGAQHIPEKYRSRAIFLTEKVMAAISTVENSQGIIAICSMAESSNADEIFGRTGSPLIYCSEVNDPGNLGTIIRTADALGCAGVLLSPGSANPFAPKVVRSTAGSLWNIPILRDVDIHVAVKAARANRRPVYAADGSGKVKLTETEGGSALWIFGNEARGLPVEVGALADAIVAIPMRGRAESLNLASAVAITLFHANS